MKIAAFSKTFDGRKVLDFPGMDLEPGKIYAVIGANGSGKSTFSKILAGVLKADRRGKWMEGGTVGYMPQKNYPFRMTTRANILLNGKDVKRAECLMDALQIRHLENKRANFLSGGETARMALARLMMKSYDVVILDEPTAAIAVRNLKNGLIRLRKELKLPETLAQAGVAPRDVQKATDQIVKATLEDPCCKTNPVKVEAYMVRQILEEVTGRV